MAVAGLAAGQARAVEFFMPVPYLGGNFVYRTEFVRQDLKKDNVDFLFAPEGTSGLDSPVVHYTVLPGPSTNAFHPLLTDNYDRDFHRPPGRSDPKYFVTGPGLVRMEGEPGLLAAETAIEIGSDPATSWELPLLTEDDAFTPGSTVWVQNLMKDSGIGSHLSIYNFDGSPATCNAKLLSPAGALIDERANLTVPSFGAIRLADITAKVSLSSATGMNAAVTCDHPFYALGSFPAKAIADIRVHYPTTSAPAAGTAVTLASNKSFRITRDSSVQYFVLPLEDNIHYRSITIDCDTLAADPINDAFYRGLLGMWRNEPSLRFGKTLYFGINERYGRSKLLVDLGTPYIEIMTKKANAPLVPGKAYHFHIEVNSDQRSFQYKVTNAGGKVIADMRSGVFNEDLSKKGDNTLIVGFGLPGIGDGAYSPPYGFRFSNLLIKGYK
jgi:hypothetical protein